MRSRNLRDEATHLRKRGKTYGDIHKLLDRKIPKSTLNYWFKNLKLSESQRILLEKRVNSKIKKARFIAVKVNKIRRQNYLASIEKRIQHLGILIQNTDVAKIAVAMLYFGEGGKNRHGALMFGNSDPRMISLFLRLLRNCYQIDESKFRCTLQCRADQNIKRLEKYWLSITKIPKKQLYKAQIDPRTIGKPSKQPDYKGVCRIDYFSADVYNELKIIAQYLSGM